MYVPTLCALLLFAVATPVQKPMPAQTPGGGVVQVLLQPRLEELTPASVFFAGKLATTQVRNSGGVQAVEGKVTEFVMVDASGYSSGIRERYQFYVMTSVAVEIGGKRLEPGAYGGGFVGGHAVIMNLGGSNVLEAPLGNDAGMKRPRPLQVVAGGKAGEYRLYLGREYVAFRQVA